MIKKTRKTRKLISCFKAEKILIKSTRLKWMIQQGLRVTKIYGFIECTFNKPFVKFVEKVSNERRKGDINPDHSIVAEMWKLIGNSAFGRTGMNKNRFSNTTYGNEDNILNKYQVCCLRMLTSMEKIYLKLQLKSVRFIRTYQYKLHVVYMMMLNIE